MTESTAPGMETWRKLVSAENGGRTDVPVWFAVRGRSMYPLLRARRDRVLVKQVRPEEMKIGDIVLFPIRGQKADYALHRLYRIDGDRVQTFGDGNFVPDPWMPKEILLGKAILILRGKREIACDDLKWVRRFRVWTSLWRFRRLVILPMRFFQRIGRRVRRVFVGGRKEP